MSPAPAFRGRSVAYVVVGEHKHIYLGVNGMPAGIVTAPGCVELKVVKG